MTTDNGKEVVWAIEDLGNHTEALQFDRYASAEERDWATRLREHLSHAPKPPEITAIDAAGSTPKSATANTTTMVKAAPQPGSYMDSTGFEPDGLDTYSYIPPEVGAGDTGFEHDMTDTMRYIPRDAPIPTLVDLPSGGSDATGFE